MGTFSYNQLFGTLLKNKLTVLRTDFFTNNVILSRFIHKHSINCALKSDLPIKWIRPEKISCFHPTKSGDLKSLEVVNLKELAPEYQDLEEIKSADENVRKLFTLEFQPYKSTVSRLRQDYISKVQRHEYDTNSPEARVAKMTSDIRDMQRFVTQFPHDKRTKVRLKETIDKRKKLLKCLRAQDYKCFEYVLEKLDLFYKPFPGPEIYKRIERKRSLRMLTDNYCGKIVSDKLQQYKNELHSQKEGFLADKIETLKWIMKEEAYCGVAPTVSDNDIKVVEEELKKLRESKND